MTLSGVNPGMYVRRLKDGVTMRVEGLDDSDVPVRTDTEDPDMPGCYWYILSEIELVTSASSKLVSVQFETKTVTVPKSITITLEPEQAKYLSEYIAGSGRDFVRQLVTDITAALKGTL